MPTGILRDGSPRGIIDISSISGLRMATRMEESATAVNAVGSLDIKRWITKMSSKEPMPMKALERYV